MAVYKKLDHKDLENLTNLMQERSQRVLRRFGEVALSGITDETFGKVLQDVKGYWTDNFRPALTSFCCEAVGGDPASTDDVSLMISLAAAGGGIHDDIIDKSSDKHFRMTIPGLHGLDYALIAGDLLITKGWAMAIELIKKVSSEKLAKIIEIFGNWNRDVCEAEFMEISCKKNLETELEVYENIQRKSIADAGACARLGAIMGDASEGETHALAEFGNCLGFMYRLAGDAKDTINVETNLALRLQNESVPLSLLYAAKSSKDNYQQIKSILAEPKISTSDLLKMQELCFMSGGFAYLLNRGKSNLDDALKWLQLLKPSGARDNLALMVQKTYSDIIGIALLNENVTSSSR